MIYSFDPALAAAKTAAAASAASSTRNYPPTLNQYDDMPHLDDDSDPSTQPDFDLEEEWVDPIPTPPQHTAFHHSLSQQAQSAYAYSPYENKPYRPPTHTRSPPTMPIIVADLPLPPSSADASPNIGPTGLNFVRRISSTAGGLPTLSNTAIQRQHSGGSFSSFSAQSSPQPKNIVGRMGRSMSIQHARPSLHSTNSSSGRLFIASSSSITAVESAQLPSALDSSESVPSIPIPFTGVGRKRSCTGPPAAPGPFSPGPSTLAAATTTAVTAGSMAHHQPHHHHHHHHHRTHHHQRQSSASSLNATNSYGYGYGYRQLPMPPIHYPAAERSPIVTPSLFQSTPLPQAEFRKPPITSSTSSSRSASTSSTTSSSSSSSPARPINIRSSTANGAPSGSRAGSAVAPSPRYPSTFGKSRGGLHQPTLDGPDPSHVPNGNGHADPTSKADTSAAAATALGTSAPSQPARALWTVGSAPATRNRASSSSSRSPRFDGFFPFNPSANVAAESESAMDPEANISSLRLPAPQFQRLYSSGELNAVGEDENEDEEGDESASRVGSQSNSLKAKDAHHAITKGDDDGGDSLVPGLLGLGFKVGSRESSKESVDGQDQTNLADTTVTGTHPLVGNGVTAALADDNEEEEEEEEEHLLTSLPSVKPTIHMTDVRSNGTSPCS
ncbi:hypothetical protein CF326_g226 [Tilletia indica]|nr:hypothetical protein CF326_g226 [Tilletia indica]